MCVISLYLPHFDFRCHTALSSVRGPGLHRWLALALWNGIKGFGRKPPSIKYRKDLATGVIE